MPPVITFFTAVGTAVGATFGLALVGTTAAIVGGIVTVGTLWLASKALERQRAAGAGAASARGALITKEGTTASIPIVYGRRRIGGHRTFLGSNGTDNQYLHMIYTLCEGPIESVDELYFNDELAASWNGSSWDFHNGYGGKLYIEAKLGSLTQTACSLQNEGLGWTASHRGYGIAYLYLKFTYDEEVYDSGLPDITAIIRGRKFLNPITQTIEYTNDPAACIYEYMTNDFYGKGIDGNLIRIDKLQEASDYYNEIVTNSDSSTEKRYEINAVLEPDATMLDNLQQLLLGCRSSLVTAEQYQLLPDRPLNTNEAFIVNDDNIIGNITYIQANKRSLLNEARARYANASDIDYNYKEDYVIVKSSTLQGSNYDNVKLKVDLEFATITSTTMVERILTEEINQSRQSGSLSVATTTQLYEATVGDLVKFTNDTLGQTDKFYRIVGQTLTADHTMELLLREYDPLVYWDNNTSIIINNKDDTDH